mmetsp:Transcript_13247/g.23749  ORF Transcript_13247/g.23749 Transcript_13247/m.23749 type:complete len:552 (-) Transcript_13247:1425-3080(-)|eukprot:CAMPEP_0203753220 /NCGR_PEP_ID=MMETSP0098-20131031/7012_1 /ASSEMBLY_ACC=CAM_ASM_000208 /TAXON_ID=96639 /ORGANISM=" , Strain NY0313808BC1" /LENGTH=551 /DNA_ID=CAMNT_0050643719 /DNA_START=409 /DNA_END=2064 /DNA_ORIENTATION=+
MGEFEASPRFIGPRPGWVFKNGAQGVGYYLDTKQQGKSNGKRKVEHSSPAPSDDTKVVVEEVTKGYIQRICVAFNKKLFINLEERAKYESTPARFMESDIQVDEFLEQVKQFASAPSLYDDMTKAGLARILIGTISHPNEDISKDALGSLVELLESDTLAEAPEITSLFVDDLLEQDFLKLLVDNMSRFDESEESGEHGVHHSIDILENLLEFKKEIRETLCTSTRILSTLLQRLQVAEFSANKLYCSEMLSILVGVSTEEELIFRKGSLANMELLLKAASLFRSVSPVSLDEEECIANIFTSLFSVLFAKENRNDFNKLDGFTLMLQIVQNRTFAFPFALEAISSALDNNPKGCERFIDSNGLRVLFPLYMGKGIRIKTISDGKKRKRSKRQRHELEKKITKHVMCVLHCLFMYSPRDTVSYKRLLRKFAEENMEKTDRLVELHVEYLRATCKLRQQHSEEAEGYLEQLEAGLDTLRHVDTVLANAISSGIGQLLKHIHARLYENKVSVSSIYSTLQDYANDLFKPTSEGLIAYLDDLIQRNPFNGLTNL